MSLAAEIIASLTAIVLGSLWFCDRFERRFAETERPDPDGVRPYHGPDAACALCGKQSGIYSNLHAKGFGDLVVWSCRACGGEYKTLPRVRPSSLEQPRRVP